MLAGNARAEAAPLGTTWSQEALEDVPGGAESPELRTLRLAEEELFGSGQPSLPEGFDPDRALSQDAVVDAPPRTFERAGQAVDLSFLKGLKLPSTPVHWDSRVLEYLLFFKDDPRGRELASSWLKRRERFGPMVRRMLSEHSLPEDLQYVAMIESGYDPRAHSQAEAWGMWQFIKQPAEYYGLRVDHWADERLDPQRSTEAAARFMRDLYDRFGSWELTFAAYNMGYGGLLRAIKKYNSNDYWMLSHVEAGLPFETSLYVAKISAMAIVANNPERFGFDKLTPEPTQQLAKVDVSPGSALSQVAEAAGIPLAQLKAVNPHLKLSRVPPGEPAVQVYVPREAQVHFAQHWPSVRARGITPQPYLVRQGETLEQVAKRTGSSVQKLRALNELDTDVTIKAGFALLVPGNVKLLPDPSEQLVCSVPAREISLPERKRVFYRVAPEDTTARVARFFEVTPEELGSWNSITPGAALHAGMLLQLFVKPELDLTQAVVYMPEEVRVLTVGSSEFFDYHESQRGRVRVRYRVQKGDTITSLSQRFELSPGSIGRINQFPSNRELRVGESVTVYAPADQLTELSAQGLATRVVDEHDPAAAAATLTERTPEDELPESQGKRALTPAPELPLAPPPKKKVEAPSTTLPTLRSAKTPRTGVKKAP